MLFKRLLQLGLGRANLTSKLKLMTGTLESWSMPMGWGSRGAASSSPAVFVVYDYHRRRGTRSAVRSKNFEHVAGVYSTYENAIEAWRSNAQRTVWLPARINASRRKCITRAPALASTAWSWTRHECTPSTRADERAATDLAAPQSHGQRPLLKNGGRAGRSCYVVARRS